MNSRLKRGFSFVLALLLAGPVIVSAADAGAPPRVFNLDAAWLQSVRQEIRSGHGGFAAALAKLETDARAALDAKPVSVVTKKGTPPSGDKHDYMSQAPYFWPNPKTTNGLPYIRRDGERNPETRNFPDRTRIDEMASAVETLSLAYYFTGQEEYAAKAVDFLRAWFLDPKTRMNPNFEFGQAVPGQNDGRSFGLIEARGFTRVVDAVGLLEGSQALSADDLRGMKDWFGAFLRWMRESEKGRTEAAAKNNHGTYWDIQAVSYALFVGDRSLAEDILKTSRQKRIALQIEPDGRQPLETARTKGWSYSVANLGGLMNLACLGEGIGVDLWHFETADGRSIRRALDYLIPFAMEGKSWPYEQLGTWPPQALYSCIRQAAAKFPEEKYRALAAKLPPENPTGRSALTSPNSVARNTPPKP